MNSELTADFTTDNLLLHQCLVMKAESNSSQRTKATQAELIELKHHMMHNINGALPISRLPLEVLRMIFHEACRVGPWWSMRKTVPIEVQLSHVCRHWRAVALGTPML